MNAAQHELRLLNYARQRLSALLEQRTIFGNSTAPHITTEIRNIRKEIVVHKQILADEYSYEMDDMPGIDFDNTSSSAIEALIVRLKELPEDIQAEVIEEWNDFLDRLDY